jgi:hypothetical protein
MQDLLLAYRSGHVLITGLLLVLMLALLICSCRASSKVHNELILDATRGRWRIPDSARVGRGRGLPMKPPSGPTWRASRQGGRDLSRRAGSAAL